MIRLPLSQEHEWFVKHSGELSEKYPGKYLAIIGERIAAIGASASEAFKRAKKDHPDEEISIAYIPTVEETVTLLFKPLPQTAPAVRADVGIVRVVSTA